MNSSKMAPESKIFNKNHRQQWFLSVGCSQTEYATSAAYVANNGKKCIAVGIIGNEAASVVDGSCILVLGQMY